MRLLGLVVVTAACSSPAARPRVETPPANQAAPVVAGPVSIGVVINGQEIWIGNETHETEENATYTGALHDLVKAFDTTPPASQFPSGSTGAIFSYATGAKILLAPGPLEQLTGRAFGVQKDYRSSIGSDLVEGITLAVETLPPTPRNILVVIGDGNDTNNDRAKAELAKLRQRLDERQASVYALVVKSAVSADGHILDALTSHVTPVASANFASTVAEIWKREASGVAGSAP